MPPRNPVGDPGEGSAHIRFHFSWTERGLRVLHAPAKLESYALPPLLQRSLGTEPERHKAEKDPAIREELIPVGSVANGLQQASWGTLNINFEPGPDRRLRIYLSISDLAFQAASDEIGVVLRRHGSRLTQGRFVRWSYHTPPLLPATYQITLRHRDNLLTRILLQLEGTASGSQPGYCMSDRDERP